jgi:hypothetical protein
VLVATTTVPLQEKSRAAFSYHYVRGFSSTYDVVEHFGNLSSLEEHLVTSLDAVSLAFFSFQYEAPSAWKPAQQKYLAALSAVKEAVSKPKLRVRNSVFLAVLFLDLYEKIASRSPVSAVSWMSHVRGAMALVKLRGPEEFNTYVGRRLSMRLFTNTLISCVAANSPLPQELIELHHELQPYVSKGDPKFQVSTLVMKSADFRATVQQGLLSLPKMLSGAISLNNDFCSLFKKLAATWPIRKITVSSHSPMILEQHFDVYPDFFATQTYNAARIVCILVNSLVRTRYLAMSTTKNYERSTDSIIDFATDTIDAMAREICASGPQFIIPSTTRSDSSGCQLQNQYCYTLLFPFYVAGVSATPASGIRQWVIGQLRAVATACANRMAGLVASVLESGDDPDPWAVYAMLGSYAFTA